MWSEQDGYVVPAQSRHYAVLADVARPKMLPFPPVGAAFVTWRAWVGVGRPFLLAPFYHGQTIRIRHS